MPNARRLGLVLGLHQLLCWGASFYLPAIIAGPAATTLGLPPAASVAAFSWALLVAGACAPLVGRRIERLGGRGVLATGALLMACGLALLALCPWFGQEGLGPAGLTQGTRPSGLGAAAAAEAPASYFSAPVLGWYGGWTLMGLGMACSLYDAAFATLGRLLGMQAQPVIAGVTLLGGFASTTSWPIGAALLPLVGWQGVAGAYALAQLLLALPLVLALVPKAPSAMVPPVTAAPVTAPKAQQQANSAVSAEPPPSPVPLRLLLCLGGFFAARWFISSAIAVHALPLFQGLGLPLAQAVLVATMLGPGQVVGRLGDMVAGRWLGPLGRARLGAALAPCALALLALATPGLGLPAAAVAIVLYGMSNGVMSIHRGSLPLALFGPRGYATLLGRLAVPVLLAQAAAPTLLAPLVESKPATLTLLLAAGLAALAALPLAALHAPRGTTAR